MTTRIFEGPIDHSTDVGYRAWVAELHTYLAAVGLVQTSDTGQINTATVTRTINVSTGYSIWRFSDSSLYLKFTWGNAWGPAIAIPAIGIQVGTGSNGSGTLTGQTSTLATSQVAALPDSTAVPYTTYLSHTSNFFCLVWKMNSVSAAYPLSVIVVGKSVDGTGAATVTGFGVATLGTTSGANPNSAVAGGTLVFQSVRIASTAATYNSLTQSYCLIPGQPTSSFDGSNIAAFLCWMQTPDVAPFPWMFAYCNVDLPKLNSVTATLVGSSSHTYLLLGRIGSTGNIAGNSGATYGLAVAFE
jgi:Predicted exporters of the RND superfamily